MSWLARGGKWPRALFWLMILAVSVLSLMPLDRYPVPFSFQDKVLHATAYFVFYLAGWWALARTRLFCPTLVVGLLLYGVAIEVLQGLGGFRTMELADLAANAVGLTLGVVSLNIFHRFVKITPTKQ